jgi:HAD superfamily phosphatase (TIGR01668 family)
MKHVRPGIPRRDRTFPLARPFCPILIQERIEDVSLEWLWAQGKRLILLDLDNTLTTWRSEEFDPPVLDWIEQAKKQGFQLALLSNSIKGHRSKRVAERFEIGVFRGVWKPSQSTYKKALAHFRRKPGEAVMLGDQLITDVLGANRTGIEAIWIVPRGQNEFPGTRVNRWLERRIAPAIYRSMTSETDQEAPQAAPNIRQQVIRFAVVGGTCWVVTTGLAVLFESRFGAAYPAESLGKWMLANLPGWLHWAEEPVAEARIPLWWLAALIAMLLNFALNRAWTFGIKGAQNRGTHLWRFYVVSILGTVFNTLLASWFKQGLGGKGAGTTILAQGFSAVIVAFWNYGGQRFFAFKD